jgi:hypothetical protein
MVIKGKNMDTTLRDYSSPPWETSVYKGIPMSKCTPEKIKVIREIVGRPLKIRYRGPRNTTRDMVRSSHTRQSSCLKENAVTFTVYYR